MRPVGAGTKKLIVAFHFLRSNPAAWKCDTCRKAGLQITRRCGWAPEGRQTASQAVWARGRVSTDECPKSLITADSIGWVEEFLVWKRLRLELSFDVNARQAEAFLILEEQLELEKQNGTE
jgi:hypothetical protein